MRTTRTSRGGKRREGGFALVAVLMIMVLMLGMNAAIHGSIMSDTSLRGAHGRGIAGFYAAEAGINRGMGSYTNIFLGYNTPTAADYVQHSFTLGPRNVKYKLSPVTGYQGVNLTVPSGETFAGLNSIHYRYTALATSEITSGDTEVSLGTEFDVNYIPLFQFLAFFQGDLEILPGPTMTVHGPIHTNGSLYLNSNNTFTIADAPPTIQAVHITAAGDIWRGRKDTSACGGTVRVSQLTTTVNHTTPLPLQNMACGSGATRTKQTDAQLATWLGSMKQKVQRIAIPSPDVVNRGTGTFWQNADLRIVLDVRQATLDASGGYPRIEVQDINGDRDNTLDARLQAFMASAQGAGRIFYNEVPTVPASWNALAGYTAPLVPFTGVNQIYPCPRTSITALCSNAALWGTCTAGGADIPASCPAYQGGIAPTVAANLATDVVTTGTYPTGGYRISRRGGFYNNREHRWVKMLNVNIHDLLAWNRAQPVANRLFDPDDTTDGGIVIFLSVQGPLSLTGPVVAADPSYGVRVYGTPNFDFPAPGADPTGVTITSDQAAYVEGDYNVDTGNTLYDATHPKMPAAIMADAINVLSNRWSGVYNPGGTFTANCHNDCQSNRPLANRPARSTAINAAFLGGVDTTVGGTTAAPGTYNGGLENYPRFHEDWNTGAYTLTYRGSFVTLGNALRSRGAWCGTGGTCNIYEAPVRAWDFDTTFQTVEGLPPLTPRVLSVEQVLFTENFR